MAKTSKKTTKASKSYRELRAELDDVVLKLQDADIDVDQAADLYEQALKAADALETYLTEAENRIRKVKAERVVPARDTDEDA
jgi:exodeoxyribonuclease VII small subunit